MARKPLDYWEKRQTELMKRLEKGTENITQIASDLGYDNYYYFTKVFTKEYGCTPTEYANRVKKCSI